MSAASDTPHATGASRPTGPRFTVVVPTVGRPSLGRLLAALCDGTGPAPEAVLVVDDRPARASASPLRMPAVAGGSVKVLQAGGRGPGAARNVGWRAASTPWIAFLDDDVLPDPDWSRDLVADLSGLPWQVAGSQGRLTVPLPTTRRPTDWERNVAGLEHGRWITADVAYRRDVLEEVGGFDERFPRAFREDADLGLRITSAGYVILQGARRVQHPVRPAGAWVSVAAQRGNADDALMRALHGAGWRAATGAEPARNGRHLATAASALTAFVAVAGRRRPLAAAAAATWGAATLRFAVARIEPGPRTLREVATMLASSAAIPVAASAHLVRGWAAVPTLLADTARAPLGQPRSPLALVPSAALRRRRHRPRAPRTDVAWEPAAMLFDRDGTLIVDVPGNADPDRVVLMPGARAAVHRARDAGLRVGVVTNQAAVGRGRLTLPQVEAINERVEAMLGPFDTWQVCPHTPEDRCACRKPAAGLVTAAALALGVEAKQCAVVGDIGSDMGAAAAAGARSVLVPTRATRRDEIATARAVAPTLMAAVDLVLGGMC